MLHSRNIHTCICQAILELADAKDFKKSTLDWDEYKNLAGKHGLEGNMLVVATRFLHETGIIRYFGDLGMQQKGDDEGQGEHQKVADSEIDDISKQVSLA
jgi:hypothetical protein